MIDTVEALLVFPAFTKNLPIASSNRSVSLIMSEPVAVHESTTIVKAAAKTDTNCQSYKKLFFLCH
jgi:hypothetical protein